MEHRQPLSTGKIVGLVLLGILVIIVLWVIGSYNSLVRAEETVKTAQSDVEVQYQRRFDLIPNLVNSVQGIFQQEQKVFIALADARKFYAGTAPGSPDRIAAINQVESSLGRLLVIVENYPDLKSSEAVLKLQDQLEGTENRISVARNSFNSTVDRLNKKIRIFPSNVIAGMFGFEQRLRFEATAGAEVAPKVDFEAR